MANESSTPREESSAKPTSTSGGAGSQTPGSVPAKRPGTIVRVSYGASVNIGEYESIRFDVTAEVGPQERWQDVFNRLRELVLKHKGTVKKDGY